MIKCGMKKDLFPFPKKFVMYGILDHCREIQVLTDRQRIIKAAPGTTQEAVDLLDEKLNGELADLALLLESYMADKQDVMEKRRKKIAAFRNND